MIQDELSLSALTSSAAKLGRGRSSTATFAGGQGSRMSSRAARLCLMMTRVPTRQPKASVLSNDTLVEYATRPTKRLWALVAARTPARAVEVTTRMRVGAQSIQCLPPKETGRPMRTCRSVKPEIIRRHVWRRVMANHSLTADAGSLIMEYPEGPPRNSFTACHVKMTRASTSQNASQRWLLSAGEIDR